MKNTVLVIFLLVLGEQAIAQKKNKGSQAVAVATQTTTLDNSVFWEISGNGLKKPSYLFGTHHLYPTDKMKTNEVVKQKIQNAEAVVGEIALDNPMALSMAMMKVVMMKDTTIRDLLGEKKFQEVDTYMKKNINMGLSMFNQMRPMVVVQLISLKKVAKDLNLDDKQMSGDLSASLDGYFQAYGKELKKEIRGLESVHLQADILFKGYSLARQAEMLIEATEDTGSQSSEMYKKLNKYYQDQDLNALASLSLDEKIMKKEEYNMMLKNRNDAWMPQIYELIQQKPAFIAVGALHLVGTDGLIYQLRQKGYVVKPIAIKM